MRINDPTECNNGPYIYSVHHPLIPLMPEAHLYSWYAFKCLRLPGTKVSQE